MTALEELPTKVSALESQISQLRDEMCSEFSATRDDARTGDDETRRTLREEIRSGDEETRRILGQRIDETKRELNDRIDQRADEVMGHARALHEALVESIKTMGEGNARRRSKRTNG